MQRHFALTATAMLLLTTAAMAQSYSLAPVFGAGGGLDLYEGGSMTGVGLKTHALQPDGKLLIAGTSWFSAGNTAHIDLVRIDPVCGALDSSFAGDGWLHHTFEQRTICNSIALQPDGKIVGVGVVGGFDFYSQSAVFRFNSDGSVDSTFNGTGYKRVSFASGSGNALAAEFHEVVIDSLGRISAALHGNVPYVGVIRLLGNGDLDSTYGENGRALIAHAYAPSTACSAAAMQPDGKVVVAAQVGTGPWDPYHLALARFDTLGVADTTFSGDGWAPFPTHGMDGGSATGYKGTDLAVLSDGRIVVSYGRYEPGNSSIVHLVVAAFLPDGTVDTGFGTDGRFEHTGQGQSGGIHVLPDDRILLFHAAHWSTGPSAVLCITPTGQLDPTFGNNGVQPAPFGGQPDYRSFHDGLMLDDGSIIGYGTRIGQQFSVLRLTADPVADALPEISFEYPDLVTTGSGTFQWYVDGEPIPGATGGSHTPATNGVYTVTMELAECSYTSAPYAFLSTGIAGQGSGAMRIFPNPTTDQLTLMASGIGGFYTVFDAPGQQVMSERITSTATVLNTSALAPGSYVIVVTDTDGGRSQLRFVKE